MINTRNVYTVEKLNSYIKNMFMQDYMLQSVFVKGEISNCKYHSSGHIYFTLKDSKSTISCVMFARDRVGLNFRLTEGQQVVVGGTVTVYERDGKYQLYAKQIVLDGAGLLYEKYEQLKKELEELGMFAPEYKQPIPRYVKTLGVVAGGSSAGLQDIIRVSTQRNPYIQIVVYPAIVQGDAAVKSVIQGIRALEHFGVDVIIVGRGGGAIEDLWAFNSREIAQAVFDCSVPIISAVGHETDTTIIDYVSDLRAPTPTAAAVAAVTDIREILGAMEHYHSRLNQIMLKKFQYERMQTKRYEMQLKYLNPVNRIREKKTHALQLEKQLQDDMQAILTKKHQKLAIYIERMKGLSPIEKLNSGFSYVENDRQQNIKSIGQVAVGETLRIRVSDGCIDTKVTGIGQN